MADLIVNHDLITTNQPKLDVKPSQVAITVLKKVFGYADFLPGQYAVIDSVLQGRDCLVVMATGKGKSLCYQIPALCSKGLTLVISPLISLMKDQVDQLLAYGIDAAYWNSSQSLEQQQVVQNDILAGKIKLLYISPEKIMGQSFFNLIRHCHIAFIAIDEAHCVSQWGHDFRPEYSQLGRLKNSFPNTPIMALTATADKTTRNDIFECLRLEDPYVYIGSFDRSNIHYTLVEKIKPTVQMRDYVISQKGKSGIIYCNSRKKVEQLADILKKAGISVAGYHAGMDNILREQVQQAFQRDNIQVIVATVAFGMGINKPNVRFVAHFDLPRSIESYYQETGRAGRDGLPANAILFYDVADYQWLEKTILDKPDNKQRAIEQHKLQAMGAFAEAQTCRRLVLLNYFGESQQTPCSNCDICLYPVKQYDGLIDAQKIFSTIYRVGQYSGIHHVISVLRGAQNSQIKEKQHDKLSVYGIGKAHSQEYWLSIIRQLIHLGFIQQNILQHGALQLTENTRAILHGQKSLHLSVPRLTISTHYLSAHFAASDYDKGLFAQLQLLRKQIADEENIPPFIIFNDATLQQMAENLPANNAEMLAISGIGTAKLKRFAAPFLQLIKKHRDK